MDTAGGTGRAGVDPGFWRGRRVLVTGHTGFKGAWLSLWLQSLGADVTGFSNGRLAPPSLYELARVAEGMESIEGDLRDASAVAAAVTEARPEIVIHMAAQSLVRRSYADPRGTYETNVMGTVNVLDAVRLHGRGVRALVNVTSDKCYENRGSPAAYREQDPMGGHDPYSSSKGCAELITASFRESFFSDPDGTRLASVRAGNVIGGGDWAADRLLPDLMRAALDDLELPVRNPDALRPWQHVLNPLSGYLMLAQALWADPGFAGGWNLGPADGDVRPVGWIVERVAELWPGRLRWTLDEGPHPHEAGHLSLDSAKAHEQLGWRGRLDLEAALASVVEWFGALQAGADMRALTLSQIEAFEREPAQPAATSS